VFPDSRDHGYFQEYSTFSQRLRLFTSKVILKLCGREDSHLATVKH
jgi:hypothetical protein